MTSQSADGFARRPLDAAVEIVAVGSYPPGTAESQMPGAAKWLHASGVLCPEAGSARSTVLPIAPGRWLWLEPDAERLSQLAAEGCVVVSVEGKWVVYEARRSVARRILETEFDADGMLRLRGCAAVTLLDCPAVVAQLDSGDVLICVWASYRTSFEAACALSPGRAAAKPDHSE